MTTDHGLRESRLVFYSDNMDQIDRVLGEFLRRAGARSAYLIDRDGHLITHVGEAGNVDPDTISALVAGSFAATKAMAKLLGEQEFSALFHQGERDNIQLSLVGGRAILTVLFDDSTTLGMVRLYTSDAVRKPLPGPCPSRPAIRQSRARMPARSSTSRCTPATPCAPARCCSSSRR